MFFTRLMGKVRRAVTWNPSDKAPSVTLSGGNLTMSPSVANSGVRATVGRSSATANGRYFECKWDVGLGVSGIKTASGTMTDGAYVGSTTDGYSYAGDGNIYNNGAGSGGYSSPTTGDVLGLFIKSNKLWVSLNGTWQNGDPSAGTGGYAVTSGTYYPAVSGQASSQQTGRFRGERFSYAIPSGGLPWCED